VIQNSRIRSQAGDLMANLAVARAEAAKRGLRITLCPSSTYNQSPPSCTTGTLGTTWNLGYIVFADQNGNGTFDSANDILITVSEPLTGNNTLVSAGFTNVPVNQLQFRPSGATNLPAAGGSFKLCDSRSGNFGRLITVSVTGRPLSAFTTCP
jgi:type IV fimbrial biogenesis protein FimT